MRTTTALLLLIISMALAYRSIVFEFPNYAIIPLGVIGVAIFGLFRRWSALRSKQ